MAEATRQLSGFPDSFVINDRGSKLNFLAGGAQSHNIFWQVGSSQRWEPTLLQREHPGAHRHHA